MNNEAKNEYDALLAATHGGERIALAMVRSGASATAADVAAAALGGFHDLARDLVSVVPHGSVRIADVLAAQDSVVAHALAHRVARSELATALDVVSAASAGHWNAAGTLASRVPHMHGSCTAAIVRDLIQIGAADAAHSIARRVAPDSVKPEDVLAIEAMDAIACEERWENVILAAFELINKIAPEAIGEHHVAAARWPSVRARLACRMALANA